MKKWSRIIYWIATGWLALGMASTGFVQLLQSDTEVELVSQLGYPAYFLTVLGVWKLFGVVAILIPAYPLLKEWTYAGFFFVMSGAILTHLIAGSATDIFPALLLLVLTVISWYMRPPDRNLNITNPQPV